jgi:hypothetical protein
MRRLNLIPGIALAAVLVFSALWVGASPGAEGSAVIGQGHVGKRHWFVVASNDRRRRGICLEVGVYNRTPRAGVDGGGQCSAPAPKRGIVIGAVKPRRGRPDITVVGGAFNPAVRNLEVVAFDGSSEALNLKRPNGGVRKLRHFRYIAFALPGPWCAERLITYSGTGDVLWEASFEELGALPSELPYDPQKVCPQT